ncbi:MULTISPECIES: hypothetical protein [unclassified Tolypothrix]|uniref:hypothetical protein n=1 Tax=unclassified Tolypothrix TaxID=2649714 RepID=UPI001D14BC7B|nr:MULTISPECIES: hypothetical protein [unclassified Tolypothrix]
MGTDESYSESTSQQGDGDYRNADDGIEDSESLLQRVREEQCRFNAAIDSLHVAVTEYSHIVAHVRELRVQRTEERSRRAQVELERPSESHEQVDYSDSRVEEYSTSETYHDRERGLSL